MRSEAPTTLVEAAILAVTGSSIRDSNKPNINGGKVAPSGTETVDTNGIGVNVTENLPAAATNTIVITVPAAKAAGSKLFGRLQATVP